MTSILSAKFYNQLWMQSADRDKHPGVLTDDGVDVPAWVAHERAFLAARVNEERFKRGLPPVPERRVKEGERVGDPDYGKRLAEHCAQLAVEK